MKISFDAKLSVTICSDLLVICFVAVWEGPFANVPVIVTVEDCLTVEEPLIAPVEELSENLAEIVPLVTAGGHCAHGRNAIRDGGRIAEDYIAGGTGCDYACGDVDPEALVRGLRDAARRSGSFEDHIINGSDGHAARNLYSDGVPGDGCPCSGDNRR